MNSIWKTKICHSGNTLRYKVVKGIPLTKQEPEGGDTFYNNCPSANIVPHDSRELKRKVETRLFLPNCHDYTEKHEMNAESVTNNEFSTRKRANLSHLTPNEKHLRRKLKNRQAAQTARDRTKNYVETLEDRMHDLEKDNINLKLKNRDFESRFRCLAEENAKLQNQLSDFISRASTNQRVRYVRAADIQTTHSRNKSHTRTVNPGSRESLVTVHTSHQLTADDSGQLLVSNKEIECETTEEEFVTVESPVVVKTESAEEPITSGAFNNDGFPSNVNSITDCLQQLHAIAGTSYGSIQTSSPALPEEFGCERQSEKCTGEVWRDREQHNIILDSALNLLQDGSTDFVHSSHNFGKGKCIPQLSDTAVADESSLFSSDDLESFPDDCFDESLFDEEMFMECMLSPEANEF